MTIGERIKMLRKSLNLKQEGFASRLRISKGFLSNLEKDVRQPSDQLIKLIAYEFFSSENWLKTGQGEMLITPREVIKNDIARFGEQVFKETVLEMMKNCEASESVVSILRESPGSQITDPEFTYMVGTLMLLWASGDSRLKSWASVQFERAFPKDIVEEVQNKLLKKQGQASAS